MPFGMSAFGMAGIAAAGVVAGVVCALETEANANTAREPAHAVRAKLRVL